MGKVWGDVLDKFASKCHFIDRDLSNFIDGEFSFL